MCKALPLPPHPWLVGGGHGHKPGPGPSLPPPPHYCDDRVVLWELNKLVIAATGPVTFRTMDDPRAGQQPPNSSWNCSPLLCVGGNGTRWGLSASIRAAEGGLLERQMAEGTQQKEEGPMGGSLEPQHPEERVLAWFLLLPHRRPPYSRQSSLHTHVSVRQM